MTQSDPVYPANLSIPVDLFVSKKHSGLKPGKLGFADSSGNIAFLVNSSSSIEKSILDPAGNPLISILRQQSGSWLGFRVMDGNKKESLFEVKRMMNRFKRIELEVIVMGESRDEESKLSNLKVKGCRFQKSCTIYQGDSIVAQTNLMYKLRQIYVRRNKFRVTIFPGSIFDHDFFVALVVVFLDGRK